MKIYLLTLSNIFLNIDWFQYYTYENTEIDIKNKHTNIHEI
jgi:uncharacterized protein (DUF486 family)